MDPRDSGSAYFEHYRGMGELIAQSMQRVHATNETIARKLAAILHLRHPPLCIHITLEAQLFHRIRKLPPPRLYLWLVCQCLPDVQLWGLARFGPGRARIGKPQRLSREPCAEGQIHRAAELV